MKLRGNLFMQLIFPAFLLIVSAFSGFGYGQYTGGDTVKAFLLGHTVELVPQKRNETTNLTTISILLDEKPLKQFEVPTDGFFETVATFSGDDGDYLVYRTFMGNGLCVAGDIFVLKFYTYNNEQNIGVLISPDLSGCLGEYPAVSFEYNAKYDVIVNVGGDKINGTSLSRWIKQKKPANKRRRAK